MRSMKLSMATHHRITIFVLATALGGAGCGAPGASSDVVSAQKDKDAEPPVFLNQGWSAETRAAFYQTSQGSRMVPYSWFLQLERADSREKFSAPANMRHMGFLVDEASPTNPDGLPVGFARDDSPTRGAAIGLTCAACHTGELQYRGKRVRIDGGQGFADLQALQQNLRDSLDATLTDGKKFDRFADDVLGKKSAPSERATLRTQVTQMRDWWNGRVARSLGQSPHGPSRTDAFTIISNEVVCNLLNVPANCAPAIAPTQFPFLWNTPDFEWVQYNSSVHSPLGRNVGEVTGVFGESRLAADGTVDSSANLPNLTSLESWLKSLTSPKWPEQILGAIDAPKAARGAQIYADQCASCHTLDPQPRSAPNMFGLTFAKVDFSTPLSQLGTDPTAAVSFATRRMDPGPWAPIAQAQGIVGPDGKAPVAALLSIATSMIIQKFFALNGLSDQQKLAYLGFRESRTATVAQLLTYKARPLNGIAFTAPYLHNGSVASMYELLLPPSERLKQFYVGSKKFDPVNVGYSTECTPDSVLLDTTLVGNSSSGHTSGTDLSHDDRMALIEYLKTL
jgi:mono/diheme cytochrome c family protein